jgi:hypothetical protein
MVETEACDFPELDSALLDLKMVPDDLEIPIPRCFREDRLSVIAQQTKELVRNIVLIHSHHNFPDCRQKADSFIVFNLGRLGSHSVGNRKQSRFS